jgi:adenylate cyclase
VSLELLCELGHQLGECLGGHPGHPLVVEASLVEDGVRTPLHRVGLELALQSNLAARPDVALVDEVQSASHTLRATLQLPGRPHRIDLILSQTTDGRAIWTEVYPPRDAAKGSEATAIDAVVDDVAAILTAERRNSASTRDMEARFAFVRGWTHVHRHSLASDRLALRHLNDAVRHDPDHAEAHAALAALYWRCWTNRCQANLGLESHLDTWDLAEAHLELAMHRPGSTAAQVRGQILAQQGQLDEALEEAERAVALDETDLDAQATLAEMIVLAGRPREALRRLTVIEDARARRSPAYLRALGRAYFGLGRFDEAVENLSVAVSRAPNDRIARNHLA